MHSPRISRSSVGVLCTYFDRCVIKKRFGVVKNHTKTSFKSICPHPFFGSLFFFTIFIVANHSTKFLKKNTPENSGIIFYSLSTQSTLSMASIRFSMAASFEM